MSFHKRIFDRAFSRHHHLNRAAAAADDEDSRADAARQSAAAAASSRAAAILASKEAAASKSAAAVAAAKKDAETTAETLPATITAPITLPGGQIMPVPHGPTPGVTEESSSPVVHETSASVVSAPHTTSTLNTIASSSAPSHSVIPAQESSTQESSTSKPTSVSGSKGLSSGAIGAIITILILLLVIVGTVIVRKVYMRRRAMKRNTWGVGLVPTLENKRSTVYGDQSTIVSEPKSSVMSVTTATSTTISTPTVSLPPPPSLSYTPSAPASVSPLIPPTVAATKAGVSSPSSPAVVIEFAVVVRTFVPTLPDELHISNGEHIRILSSFDDGWALCSNIRGEQGVVPLECLHRETGFSAQMQLQPESEFGYDSNKATRRLSSLVPSTGATY